MKRWWVVIALLLSVGVNLGILAALATGGFGLRSRPRPDSGPRPSFDGAVHDVGDLRGPLHDERKASNLLVDIVDAGYDATLISGELDGVLTFNVLVGPYDGLIQANAASRTLRDAYQIETSIMVRTEASEIEP